MDGYKWTEDEQVLLLGEGNFSFAVSLLEAAPNPPKLFLATCFESQPDSPSTLNNIKHLTELGAEVKTGVDATKLNEQVCLYGFKFNRIVFNFPHVGGKMKIQLNRRLLKDFFESSGDLLEEKGEVTVALCRGQGGTDFEIESRRRWNDTWQITEAASHGDYVLTEVFHFPSHLLSSYVSSGFRGTSKSFNTEGALVHVFRKADPLCLTFNLDTVTTYYSLPRELDITVPYIYSSILDQDPFEEGRPHRYFIDLLVSCGATLNNEIPLIVEGSDKSHASCKVNNEKCFLRTSLSEVIPPIVKQEGCSLYFGAVFRKLNSDFSSSPVRCEVAITGDLSEIFYCSFLNKISEIFPLLKTDSLKELPNVVTKTIISGDTKCLIIDLDFICSLTLKIASWHQLYSSKSQFSTNPHPVFKPMCFPSQTYSFDINFITSPDFNEDGLLNILWNAGENCICTVLLLNTYTHFGDGIVSHCYRIIYKSYDKPLHRSRVVRFHNDVIATALTQLFKVTIS